MHCNYSEFSDIVIEHFMSPRNAGAIPDANGEGRYGDYACGDSLTLYIKVEDNRIKDIKFLAFGCVAAIASSSMTTELAMGKTIEEASKITEDDIASALGGLPENKIHCSLLGAGALKNAIQDYLDKNR